MGSPSTAPAITPIDLTNTSPSLFAVASELSFVAQYFNDATRPGATPSDDDKRRIKALLDSTLADLTGAIDRAKAHLGLGGGGGVDPGVGQDTKRA